MAQQPVGYFDYNGESRYSDGKGGVFHNHMGPALNSLGALDPRRFVNSYMENNPLITDANGKSRVAPKNSSAAKSSASNGTPIAPRLNTGRGAMFMDPVGQAPEMPGASSFMDPVAPPKADVTRLATKPGRQDVALVPDSTVYSGRNDTRVSPTNMKQTGTNMSRSFNDLLATTNTSGYQPFGSNQLPTTAGSPDAAVSPKTQAITNIGPVADGQEYANNLGRQGTRGIGPVADGQVYGNVLENSAGAGTKGIGPLADGAAYAKAVEGKGKSTSRLDAALNDKAGIQSYMKKFSGGAQERAANRAFLDTEDSMLALRAKEAVNGVVYAQGQHYVAGEKADSPAQKINRSEARDISNGRAKAEDFKDRKVADVVAASKQEPTVLQDGAKNQAFKQDTPIASQMPSDIGGKTEYYSNNDNIDTSFGQPKGFKSGFKRIDTSIKSPFG